MPGITDVVMPGIGDVVQGKTSTFHVRVGVCYTNKDGSHPPGNFEIKRGYRSWGGNGVEFNDPELRKKFNYLDQVYQGERCFNLGSQTPQILNDPAKGCPAHGIIGRGPNDSCPAGSTATVDRNNLPICAFAPTTLTQANSLGEITNADGTPNDINKWFYDNGTGMLFFYVAQDRPNAVGSTPLGSCAGGASDSACPDPNSPNDATKENYYTCPPEGCITYSVRLATTTPYDPGPSACGSKPEYTQPAPKDANQLAFVVPSGTTPAPPFQDGSIVQAIDAETKPTFKHRLAGFGGNAVSPVCPGTP
jgi:hypothetical protein